MEKTIEEDLKRKIVYQRLINDNTLLEYYYKGNDVFISVRFVASEVSGIKEHILKVMDAEDFSNNIFRTIEINEDRSAIALFDKVEDGYRLSEVYYTDEHAFEAGDFIDLAYQKKFPNKKLKKGFMK